MTEGKALLQENIMAQRKLEGSIKEKKSRPRKAPHHLQQDQISDGDNRAGSKKRR